MAIRIISGGNDITINSDGQDKTVRDIRSAYGQALSVSSTDAAFIDGVEATNEEAEIPDGSMVRFSKPAGTKA